jgi:hypothetical protein
MAAKQEDATFVHMAHIPDGNLLADQIKLDYGITLQTDLGLSQADGVTPNCQPHPEHIRNQELVVGSYPTHNEQQQNNNTNNNNIQAKQQQQQTRSSRQQQQIQAHQIVTHQID